MNTRKDEIIFSIVRFFIIIGVILTAVTTILTIKKVNREVTYQTLPDFTATITDVSVLSVSDNENSEGSITESATTEFTINMNFVGDLLLATDEYTAYENCFNDVADVQSPDYFLSQVSDIFLNDDITVGDCENVFSDSDGLTVSDKGQYTAAEEYAAAVAAAQAAGQEIPENDFQAFWFKSKSSNANIISAGGVDIVSIDNNHINDYGQQGKEDTKAALEAAGVEWGNSGQTVYKEINGFKIAFIFGSMYNSGQEADILANLNEAKEQSDYQIIYFHGGTEAVHEPEDWKISACHDLVDNGADLILGDHPHVLQPMEEYNGAYIVYSLGNFCFGGNRHPENRTIIFNETLTVTQNTADGTYEITDKAYDITPCYVYTGDTNNWQPKVIEDEETKNKVLDFMQGLTDSPL
jgi:poly-gamma-glutamate synthesis protein (capsule biosynthesis protein)